MITGTEKARVVALKPSSYPILKKFESKTLNDDGSFIVLFTAPKSGVVVVGNKHWSVGKFATYWDEDGFVYCDDIVTLENV